MKAFLIDPDTQTVSVQDYDGQPHSLYTLFGSLLVDSNALLNAHMVYSGGEAFEKGQKGFFLGEKLLFGKTLVVGMTDIEEVDATIEAETLQQLLRYELPAFYRQAIALLPPDFAFDQSCTLEGMEGATVEWVFYAFSLADDATQSYFLDELKKTVSGGGEVHPYLEKMGNLAIRSMQ
ncbi:hypothetical protein LOH54_06660 [Sulfurimonas sp. HSL-3221]|uniref:hypothetical protein n=1 Tax=Sulfurimonadaceae TaxID=2771471 RepID=UPI001E29B618|nr:hypothetical protein [Sulfurimonas sp. HSL-3221]UFS61342.1 hypothetical protein LOH54_06660 [Sulfurimonas sp. HSL-3221]